MADNEIKGRLDPFYAQETEGVICWSLLEDGRQGWDALHSIENGDLLTIFNDEARTQVIWQGTVDLEFTSHRQVNRRLVDMWRASGIFGNLTEEQLTGMATEQYAGPELRAVRGLQKGVDGDFWTELFYAGKPATLIPKSGPAGPA